jgi:hypothetical protein
MEQYVTLYKVKFFSHSEEQVIEECGIIIAENYTDAAHQLENYYGNDLVEIFYIGLYEPRTLRIPNDKFNEMKTYLEDLV